MFMLYFFRMKNNKMYDETNVFSLTVYYLKMHNACRFHIMGTRVPSPKLTGGVHAKIVSVLVKIYATMENPVMRWFVVLHVHFAVCCSNMTFDSILLFLIKQAQEEFRLNFHCMILLSRSKQTHL